MLRECEGSERVLDLQAFCLPEKAPYSYSVWEALLLSLSLQLER
jgi:hypothetical protein